MFAAADSLDQFWVLANVDGEHWSIGGILAYGTEKYARHCGHADFLRESIGGALG